MSERVLTRLRSETAAAHERLEACVGLGDAEKVTRAQYVRYLKRVGGFHEALEQVLCGFPELEAAAGLSERLRGARARADLRALGADGAFRPELPSLATAAEAMGALYVLEGATLGAQVLRRQLVRQLGDDVASALTYLDGYGERTGDMWRALRAALVAFAAKGAEAEDQLVAGALRTFEALERSWGAADGAERRALG